VTLQKFIAQGGVANYHISGVKLHASQRTLNLKYQEWDFTIYSSKRLLTSILYLRLLLNYKNTVAFYQQSSQETNKMYTLSFEVWYSLETYFHIKLVSRKRLYIFTFICSENMPLDLLFENVDKLCAD
jgi:hypothetical protein